MKTAIHVVALAVGSLLMSGCQQGKDPASVSEAPVAPLQITEIRIGPANKAGDAPPQPQTTKLPIALEIKTRGSSSGAQLEAKLINLKNGQQAGLINQRIVASDPTSTRLIFKSPSGWSAGRHLIEIKLDGKLVEQRDFDIFDPPLQ